MLRGEIFKTIIPLVNKYSDQDFIKDKSNAILEFCKIARSRDEIQDFVGIKSISIIMQIYYIFSIFYNMFFSGLGQAPCLVITHRL